MWFELWFPELVAGGSTECWWLATVSDAALGGSTTCKWLSVCPACGAESFSKQLTAAGFQLKGSGWYATDFKGGGSAAASATAGAASDAKAEGGSGTGGAGDAPAAAAAAAPSTPCGGSCACH